MTTLGARPFSQLWSSPEVRDAVLAHLLYSATTFYGPSQHATIIKTEPRRVCTINQIRHQIWSLFWTRIESSQQEIISFTSHINRHLHVLSYHGARSSIQQDKVFMADHRESIRERLTGHASLRQMNPASNSIFSSLTRNLSTTRTVPS